MSARRILHLARAAGAASPTMLALSPAVTPAVTPAGRAPGGGDHAPPHRVRLDYVEHGSPGGPAVIFLHGLGDSSFSFSEVLPLLAPEWRAIALDLRGHGRSDQPADGHTMPDLREFVAK